MRRRSDQLNSAISYIRGKIRRKTWNIGNKTDSITAISRSVGVSRPTILNAINILEGEGLLENRGREGVWITNKLTSRSSSVFKLSSIKNNLLAAKLLSQGGIFSGKHQAVIARISDHINVLFPITGTLIVLNIDSILKVKVNMIRIDTVLNTKTSSKKIREYKEQLKVLSVFDIILPYKKELHLEM